MMMGHVLVRKHRLELGVSQALLARATGIHRTILSAFETGQLSLRGDCARRVRDYFVSRGMPLPEPVKAPEPDPGVVAELRWVESQIAAIEAADCEKGFLDSFFEREKEERETLLVLLERARVLRESLANPGSADPVIEDTPETQADFLAMEYRKLLKKLDKAER